MQIEFLLPILSACLRPQPERRKNLKAGRDPSGLHDQLIGMCDPKSREYDTLVNGFIIRDGNEEAVQIACDHAGTELICQVEVSRNAASDHTTRRPFALIHGRFSSRFFGPQLIQQFVKPDVPTRLSRAFARLSA
jgi:hypothetical protein